MTETVTGALPASQSTPRTLFSSIEPATVRHTHVCVGGTRVRWFLWGVCRVCVLTVASHSTWVCVVARVWCGVFSGGCVLTVAPGPLHVTIHRQAQRAREQHKSVRGGVWSKSQWRRTHHFGKYEVEFGC